MRVKGNLISEHTPSPCGVNISIFRYCFQVMALSRVYGLIFVFVFSLVLIYFVNSWGPQTIIWIFEIEILVWGSRSAQERCDLVTNTSRKPTIIYILVAPYIWRQATHFRGGLISWINELTKLLDTVILEDLITPEVNITFMKQGCVVRMYLCSKRWEQDIHKVRSFYCSAVDFILYMLALCFWANQLFIAIIRLIIRNYPFQKFRNYPFLWQVHLRQVPNPNAQSLSHPKGQGWAFHEADQVFETSHWQDK